MKRVNWILSIGIIAGLTLYASCGGTDPVPPVVEDTPQDIARANLSKNWGLGTSGSIRRDGQDVTDDFSGFTISFTESGSYTASGGGDVWPDGSGTWSFTGTDTNDASSITIGGDNVEINVASTSLLLQFNIAEDGAGIGARVSGINGDWEFSMVTN
jgi:hypothetical protein